MTRINVLLAAALLAACSNPSGPVGPAQTGLDSGDGISTTANAPVPAGFLAPSLIPMRDVLDRVLGVLPDQPAREDLRAVLIELSRAVEAQDRCTVRARRGAAEEALRALGRHQPEEYEPDLSTVELALESVEMPDNDNCP